MEDIYVLGVDIGGSHIACQLVNLSDCSLIENTYAEVKVAENQSAGIILAAWEKALKECMGKAAGKIIRGIGVASITFRFCAGDRYGRSQIRFSERTEYPSGVEPCYRHPAFFYFIYERCRCFRYGRLEIERKP